MLSSVTEIKQWLGVQTISSRERAGRVRYACRCSYFEVAGERVRDLLQPSTGKQLTLSHDHQGLWVEGLHEQVVLNGALPPLGFPYR